MAVDKGGRISSIVCRIGQMETDWWCTDHPDLYVMKFFVFTIDADPREGWCSLYTQCSIDVFDLVWDPSYWGVTCSNDTTYHNAVDCPTGGLTLTRCRFDAETPIMVAPLAVPRGSLPTFFDFAVLHT